MQEACPREIQNEHCVRWYSILTSMLDWWYEVATGSRIDKMIGLFCRISSLL